MECFCCGDGGNVVLCDFCNHSMCSNCIMLHQGEAEVSRKVRKVMSSGKLFILWISGNVCTVKWIVRTILFFGSNAFGGFMEYPFLLISVACCLLIQQGI